MPFSILCHFLLILSLFWSYVAQILVCPSELIIFILSKSILIELNESTHLILLSETASLYCPSCISLTESWILFDNDKIYAILQWPSCAVPVWLMWANCRSCWRRLLQGIASESTSLLQISAFFALCRQLVKSAQWKELQTDPSKWYNDLCEIDWMALQNLNRSAYPNLSDEAWELIVQKDAFNQPCQIQLSETMLELLALSLTQLSATEAIGTVFVLESEQAPFKELVQMVSVAALVVLAPIAFMPKEQNRKCIAFILHLMRL